MVRGCRGERGRGGGEGLGVWWSVGKIASTGKAFAGLILGRVFRQANSKLKEKSAIRNQ